MEKEYKIRYLPIAVLDMQSIIDYITVELKAYKAALNLLVKFEKAISSLKDFPQSGVRYKRDRQLDFDYRMLMVENYIVFYTVLEDTVEIERVIYSRRKLDEFL